jgi:acyl-CoA reductase-like NAD-dependent aldehyde dehydrogenase
MSESVAALRALLDDARRARERVRSRPRTEIAAALAAAAARWRDDAALVEVLPPTIGLSPANVAAAIAIAAEALDAAAMIALVEAELGGGAARGGAPSDAPALVAHVLASNVPALALPAIALGCLAGAAVLVKSGRDDPCSAPAFRQALAAVDPDLAATVVATYWRGGEREPEEVALGAADVVVLTGGDAALAAFAGRLDRRLVVHGPRTSVAVVGRAGLADATGVAEGIALDVALHDQRGCLSPHVVWIEEDRGLAARAFAERLAAALDTVATRLPPGPADLQDRAATRLGRAEAEWAAGTQVWAGRGGTVVYEEAPSLGATSGRRTVHVHPLPTSAALPGVLPPGLVECVGLAGLDGAMLAGSLCGRGVSRICRVGSMQRPPLAWPRGQQAPLGSLLGRAGKPKLEVEP